MYSESKDFSFPNLFTSLTTKKALAIIIILGFLVYFNTLFGGFVWDDLLQIRLNSFVQSLNNIPLFFHHSTFTFDGRTLHGMYYRPLMMVSFTLIYSLFGLQPFFFHLLQISLFIINSILVF